MAMNDPRLNSVHLDFPRREDFRRARDRVLGARGSRTLAEERLPDFIGEGNSYTAVAEPADREPANADHWLVSRDVVYPLKTGVNTIGRLPDNDVVIDGPFVSRRHCAILVHVGDGAELYDIASKNGTFVNGLKLSGPIALASGDEIRLCDLNFVFMSKLLHRPDAAHDHTRSGPV